MKQIRFFSIASLLLLLGTMVSLSEAQSTGDHPSAWIAAGSKPKSYQMGTTTEEHHSGTKCAYIKSKASQIEGFGTYMQTATPGDFVGKNIRMTAWIKTKDVKNWAGMWLRVDGLDLRKTLAFDNMQNRPIVGTNDWKKYEIVLDVPPEAKDIAFGVLLDGTGQVFFDDINFEVLGPATGKTGMESPPTDLNFEN